MTLPTNFQRSQAGALGLDPTETLEALNPQLASGDAETDGMALKRMIATGVGIPMTSLLSLRAAHGQLPRQPDAHIQTL